MVRSQATSKSKKSETQFSNSVDFVIFEISGLTGKEKHIFYLVFSMVCKNEKNLARNFGQIDYTVLYNITCKKSVNVSIWDRNKMTVR